MKTTAIGEEKDLGYPTHTYSSPFQMQSPIDRTLALSQSKRVSLYLHRILRNDFTHFSITAKLGLPSGVKVLFLVSGASSSMESR